MYGRTLDGQDLTFEASGGLINGTLVLQDRETDSYWPIMAGRSVEGALDGTELPELAVARKRSWADWRREHPDTLVLSVEGEEDAPPQYGDYFASPEGFRGTEAEDDRLPTKAPIFAFRLDGRAVAVPHAAFVGGRSFETGDTRIHLYRAPGAPLFESSAAFRMRPGSEAGRCRFDPGSERFPDGCAEPLPGFDTFWYSWSLNNPGTYVLGGR